MLYRALETQPGSIPRNVTGSLQYPRTSDAVCSECSTSVDRSREIPESPRDCSRAADGRPSRRIRTRCGVDPSPASERKDRAPFTRFALIEFPRGQG